MDQYGYVPYYPEWMAAGPQFVPGPAVEAPSLVGHRAPWEVKEEGMGGSQGPRGNELGSEWVGHRIWGRKGQKGRGRHSCRRDFLLPSRDADVSLMLHSCSKHSLILLPPSTE